MTAGIPVLDTAPEIRPASDEEIKSWRINNDPGAVGMMTVGLPKMQTDKRGMMRLIARIEADRARIAVLEARLGKHTTDTPCPACSQPSKDAATIAKQAQEIERLEKHNRQLDAEGSALAMELARVKSMTVHEFRKRIAEPRFIGFRMLRADLSKPEPGR